jgi:hypothetical protein
LYYKDNAEKGQIQGGRLKESNSGRKTGKFE